MLSPQQVMLATRVPAQVALLALATLWFDTHVHPRRAPAR
jgi:hypothetical protein